MKKNKTEKATINPVNKKDNKCFQYVVTVPSNHEEVKKYLERITKIKLFINEYNWERIYFPSKKEEWKKCEKNNLTIALNVFYAKKEKAHPAYVSKHNSNCEKQAILLIIPNGEGSHYLAVKKRVIKRNKVKTPR